MEKTIQNCSSYKYLGEIISRNGKNAENIKDKLEKVKTRVTEIITCARSDIMRRIRTSVFLKLHEAEAVPTLSYGCKTWTLDSKVIKLLERIELWALKRMFGLPPTTPTAGMRYTTGTYFTEVRIQIKQLIYLQSLLRKETDQLLKDTLITLDYMNDGWAKYIHTRDVTILSPRQLIWSISYMSKKSS